MSNDRRFAVRRRPRQPKPWRQHDAFFDGALDAIVIVNDAARIIDANPAACALSEYSMRELRRLTIRDLIDWPGGAADFKQQWRTFRRGGALNGECTIRRKAGTPRIVEYRAIAGVVPRAHVVSMRDVTARNEADAELRRQKELLQLIVDHIPVMLNFIDMDGRITWINQAWQDVLGWSLDEVRTLDIYAAAFPDLRDRTEALRALRSRHAGWRDLRLRRKDGQYIDSAWAMVSLADGTAIGIGQDIRERRRVEEELRASREQLRRLSARVDKAIEHERTQLARELHDQLGQSLTALKIDVAWLASQPAMLADNAKPVRDKAAAIGGAIDATIRDVRRISAGLRPVTLDRLGLLETIEWQTEQYERQTGMRCRFESHVDAVDLGAERAMQVFRILQEALTNATRHAKASRVSIAARADNGWFELEIRDNGRGISDDALANRSSLGLLGMRERALLAGGDLNISRAGRRGTVVRVRVPLSRRPLASSRRAGRKPAPGGAFPG